ncbi:MAG: hypothetical protein ABI321_03035 [Polyangia bacterium]
MKAALALSLGLCGVAGAKVPAAKEPAPTITYYYGRVTYRSPVGDKVMGMSTLLLERSVRSRSIEEREVASKQRGGETPIEHVVTLARTGTTATYEVSDSAKIFSGTVVFDNPGSWTYRMKLANGTQLGGTGTLRADGLHTRKVLADAGGTATMLVHEDLRVVQQPEYEALRTKLVPR